MAKTGRLPQVQQDMFNFLPPGLRCKVMPAAAVYFVLYMLALGAYLAIRIVGIVKEMNNWGERGYSIAILVVEVIGVSALIPYGFANCRPVLPIKEDEEQVHNRTWQQFGCRTQFDVFVLVPCYKESWSTIKRTLMCAMFARVPPGCRKHIVLGNDGHDVNNPNCQARPGLVQQLVMDVERVYGGREPWFYAVHESRRPKLRQNDQGANLQGNDKRIAGNAKSLNLNHCIKKIIPRILSLYHPHKGDPSNPCLADFDDSVLRNSVVVVLDCDMAISNDPNEFNITTPPRNGDGVGFFPKILRVLEDCRYDLVLTPQYFTNVHDYADAFNHRNPQFWEYILPGLTSLGYVACTGTNMGLRLSMLHHHNPTTERDVADNPKRFTGEQGVASARYETAMQGPFPVYSVTEDYALSLELKKAGVKGTYHAEYLVCGAAPHGIVAVDIQRGRWTEGHWQIFFSLKNPMFSPFKLGFMGTIYYNYGTWAYLCNIVTIWVYQFVPLLSALGIQPVAFSNGFRWAATIYLILTMAVQYYVREAPHFFGMWRANMSNILLSWTYMKAIMRALLRKKSGFATHTEDSQQPEDELMANPPTPEVQPDSLVQERVGDIVGHLIYFTVLLMLSLATVVICLAQSIKAGKLHSRFMLPASWAAYNAVGPVLMICAATLKKTNKLELAMYLLSMIHTICAFLALASMWFVNSRLTIGFNDSSGQ